MNLRIDPQSADWQRIESYLEDLKLATLEKMANPHADWSEVLRLRGKFEAISDLMNLPYQANDDQLPEY